MHRRTDKSSSRERIACNLRMHRLALGLSQEEVGYRAGLHRTYVGSIERAERNLTVDNVDRLALVLDLDAVDLLMPLAADPLEPG
jgi:transcriptional regulator with XRE-family HTH domain